MIKRISASDFRFKPVEFTPGLNIVLAERTKLSGDKDSCNGLGKSTLILIIDYLLGRSAKNAQSIVTPKELYEWAFEGTFFLNGSELQVERSTAVPGKIKIRGRDSNSSNQNTVQLSEWTSYLGRECFAIDADDQNAPSFRALIGYFVRYGQGAFLNPFETFAKMKAFDRQLNNSFLLGLDWTIPVAFQTLKQREDMLTQLKREAAAGTLVGAEGNLEDLEISKVRLEKQLAKDASELASFKVHPQYAEIEISANQFTRKIRELSDANYRDRMVIDLYQKTLSEEREASDDQIRRLYTEAGLLFPDAVTKRLSDVEEFHKNVARNRKNYLQAELTRLKHDIASREIEIEKHSFERAQLLDIMKTHGALEEHTALQQRHTRAVAELESVRTRISNLKRFQLGKAALESDKSQLKQKAIISLDEKSAERDLAIELFDANVRTLYDHGGNLLIKTLKEGGFDFDYTMERKGSTGIDSMAILCYDLALSQIWSQRTQSPGILIHDSTMFDGVDARQRARALEFIAVDSIQRGYQYICTLNEDEVPFDDFSPGFDFDQFVRLRLTDASPDGSLLGLRIGQTERPS